MYFKLKPETTQIIIIKQTNCILWKAFFRFALVDGADYTKANFSPISIR